MKENNKEYLYRTEKKLNSFKNNNKDDNYTRRRTNSKTERISLTSRSNINFHSTKYSDKIFQRNIHFFNDKEIFKRRLTQFYKSRKSKSKLTYDLIKSGIKKNNFLEMLPSEEDETENLINIIKLENNERTPKDILNIKNFLIKSKLVELFRFRNSNEEILDKLLINSCINCKYKFLEKECELYKKNDLVDNFYIIIKGKIGVYKAFNKIKYMSGFKYFQYLYDLYMKNENYILKIVLKQNYNIFPIKESMLPELNINVAYKLIEKYKKNKEQFINNSSFYSIDDILKECFFNPLNYVINNNIINDNHFNYELLCETKIQNIVNIIEYQLIQEYINDHYIEPIDNKTFIINYKSNFENYKNNDNNYIIKDRRLYMAKTLSDTHICYFNLNNYYNILITEYNKILHKDAKFLIDNFIFKYIYKQFEEKYFSFFEYIELNINQFLFEENQSLEYIYFLKEGIVEFSMNKNIFQIYSLLEELNLIMERKKNQKEEKLNSCNNHMKLDNNNNNIIKKYFGSNSHEIKLVILEKSDNIGIECLYFDINYFYSVKIIRKPAILYRIKKEKFFEILKNESQSSLEKHYVLECERKIDFFMKRLRHLIKVKLNFVQKKLNNYKLNKDIKKFGRNSHKLLKVNMNLNVSNQNKSVKNIKKINELLVKKSYDKNENKINLFTNSYFYNKNKKFLSPDKKDIISKNNLKKLFTKINNKMYSRNQNKLKLIKKKNYFSQSEQNLLPSNSNRAKQKSFQNKEKQNIEKDSNNNSEDKSNSYNSKMKLDLSDLMMKFSKLKKYRKNSVGLKSEKYLLQKIQKNVIYDNLFFSKIDINNINNLNNEELNNKLKINIDNNSHIKNNTSETNEFVPWKYFHYNKNIEPISNKQKDKRKYWYKNINKIIRDNPDNDYSSINNWIYGIKDNRNNVKLIANKEFFKSASSLLS